MEAAEHGDSHRPGVGHRRRLIKNRPELLAALDHLHAGDMLVVTKAKDLAQTMLECLDVLNGLVEQGFALKVIEGMAAGDHTERSHDVEWLRLGARLLATARRWDTQERHITDPVQTVLDSPVTGRKGGRGCGRVLR